MKKKWFIKYKKGWSIINAINQLYEVKKKVAEEKEEGKHLAQYTGIALDEILYSNEKFEKYKEWFHDTKKGEKVKIVEMWPTDYDDLGCTAILYKNDEPVAKILESFDECTLRYVYGDQDTELTKSLLKKSFKSLILDNFDYYINLPKISDCSKLLQEVYDTVCESDSAMCHIDYGDWDDYYNENYTIDDLKKLKEEIKKYKLENVLEVDNGEYQILGYGNLQFMFKDTREYEKESGLELG